MPDVTISSCQARTQIWSDTATSIMSGWLAMTQSRPTLMKTWRKPSLLSSTIACSASATPASKAQFDYSCSQNGALLTTTFVGPTFFQYMRQNRAVPSATKSSLQKTALDIWECSLNLVGLDCSGNQILMYFMYSGSNTPIAPLQRPKYLIQSEMTIFWKK